MLRWCSYCQRFLGEAPPYEDLSLTHTICPVCLPGAISFTSDDLAHVRVLKGIQERLRTAGQQGDLRAAERIFEDAATNNMHGIDLLAGIIAPMLYQVGDDWKQNIISVADEHRFTTFCEQVFAMVSAKVENARHDRSNGDPGVVLVNADGNRHTVAVRLLQLWLADMGVMSHVVEPSYGTHQALERINRIRPTLVLISMALAEQRSSAVGIVDGLAALPPSVRPRVIVGGNAVKLGLVPQIPGADLMADISGLKDGFR